MGRDEIQFEVEGLLPAKNEAKSMLAEGHQYHRRVIAFLTAARESFPAGPGTSAFGDSPVGLEVTVSAPTRPPSDATNYLGGISDVLETKSRRGVLTHLGDLAAVALYDNDNQIQEMHYSWQASGASSYRVRIWPLR